MSSSSMTQQSLSDSALLEAIGLARNEFDKQRVRELANELVRRGVYPQSTPEGNPNSVEDMVMGWGAYWHIWTGTNQVCPKCNSDLRDLRTGPPFLRVISVVINDRVSHWKCPDCGGEWSALD